MKYLSLACASLLTLAAVPAVAQDTAPPPPVTVSGGATLVSDYRFRGISQTNLKPALQGTFTVAHESGFYVSVWGSSIDDYVANGSDQELDLIAGYTRTFANGLKLDGGLLYYYYPGGGSANTDFAEPYLALSHSLGPATAKITANYAWKQRALSLDGVHREDNFYLAGDLSSGIPTTPFSVSAHLGHTFGQSYLSVGNGYTDWNVGASYTWNHLTAGISYVDTDKDVFYVAPGHAARNITKAGIVASLGVAF